jgi:hypothetical protein
LCEVSEIPYQLQLLFTRLDGSQVLRVSTSSMRLTGRDNAGQKLDVNVVATQAVQRIGSLIQKGLLDQARQELRATRSLLLRNGVAAKKLQVLDECEMVLNRNNNNNNNGHGEADAVTEQAAKLMHETMVLI